MYKNNGITKTKLNVADCYNDDLTVNKFTFQIELPKDRGIQGYVLTTKPEFINPELPESLTYNQLAHIFSGTPFESQEDLNKTLKQYK